jgi:hypothetical protein
MSFGTAAVTALTTVLILFTWPAVTLSHKQRGHGSNALTEKLRPLAERNFAPLAVPR